MPTLTLHGKLVIGGAIEAVTGLHIGGAAAGLEIGGVDNPVIRHAVTRQPYIPGSSLRGKMRSLLDRHLGRPANKHIARRPNEVRVHECETQDEYLRCPVCQVFGITPGEHTDFDALMPTRLIVRDAHLSPDSVAWLQRASTDMPFTEVKTEVAIDRITSAAVPRQNERVPSGAQFAPFEMIFSIYELDGAGVARDIGLMAHVFKGMELLEDDYLGGYGSRGSGKVQFRDLTVALKPRAYYEGDEGALALLDKDKPTLRDLRVAEYPSLVEAALAG